MNIDIEKLLEEAEKLLYDNIDEEIKQLENKSYPVIINPDKYKKLEEIYNKVLEIEPENKKAKQGIEICNDMLDEYLPVQYIGPGIKEIIDAELLKPSVMEESLLDKNNTESLQNLPDRKPRKVKAHIKLMPWEIRKEMLGSFRKNDKAGIEYTSKMFSEATEKAEQKVEEIIKKIKQKFQNSTRIQVYKKIEQELKEYQEILDNSWKGHGPDILYKLYDLAKELNI